MTRHTLFTNDTMVQKPLPGARTWYIVLSTHTEFTSAVHRGRFKTLSRLAPVHLSPLKRRAQERAPYLHRPPSLTPHSLSLSTRRDPTAREAVAPQIVSQEPFFLRQYHFIPLPSAPLSIFNRSSKRRLAFENPQRPLRAYSQSLASPTPLSTSAISSTFLLALATSFGLNPAARALSIAVCRPSSVAL